MTKPKKHDDDKPDLLSVLAHAVERMSRLGHKEVHADVVAAIAAHEGTDDASNAK